MALELRQYTLDDMQEQDYDSAPSLDLPAFAIEKFFLPKDSGKYMLFFANVKKDWQPKGGCPYCSEKTNLIRDGRTSIRHIHDVVRNNYCTSFLYQPIRLKCNSCGQRFVPNVDGIVAGHPYTERLLDYVKTESFLQSHTKLAETTGLSITTIQNIMDEEIERYDNYRKEHPMDAPRVLGIDEKHIFNKMRGVLADSGNSNLIDMLEDNSQASFTKAIKSLNNWDKNIKVVTTDMANAYIKWLKKLLPNATIVVDHFHVIQDIQKKLSKTSSELYEYRKQLIDKLEDSEEKARQKAILNLVLNNKRLFNYSTETLIRDEKHGKLEKMVTVMDEFPEFMLLRMLYAKIEEMYQQETRKDAEALWNEWQEMLPPTTKEEYQKWCDLYSLDDAGNCFEAFKSLNRGGFSFFKEYILNYFNPGCRETNGPTEGMNNLIERINREGNGYGFRHLRAKALYSALINERVQYTFDKHSVSAWVPTMQDMTIGRMRNISDMLGNNSSTGYIFGKRIEHISIPVTNGLSDNTAVFTALSSEGDECWHRHINEEHVCIVAQRNIVIHKWDYIS